MEILVNHDNERIRWACRRGMLELDLFLVPFYENCYQNLTDHEQTVFCRLLTATDPQLLSYFMAHTVPEDAQEAKIVTKIRSYRTTLYNDSD